MTQVQVTQTARKALTEAVIQSKAEKQLTWTAIAANSVRANIFLIDMLVPMLGYVYGNRQHADCSGLRKRQPRSVRYPTNAAMSEGGKSSTRIRLFAAAT